jgi:hypothetical protein
VILCKIKEVAKLLTFAKKAFTKGGFRHVVNYISGLIACVKKTVKKISESIVDEGHHSAIDRILNEAKFEKEILEKRYLRKIKHLFKNSEIYLLIDDTLVERNGKKIEETQKHFDHTTNSFVNGHQFFTAILHTPFLELPLFPELYSKNTITKIEMAKNLVDKLESYSIKIDTVLFDSWYSDEELINKCLSSGSRVICAIKTNRKIKFRCTRKWRSLSFITERINPTGYPVYKIGNKKYNIADYQVRLNHVKLVKLLVSHEYNEDKNSWNKIHLISTNPDDNPEEIVRAYKIRWRIETYHRDIKQNLGFAKTYLRKRESIVRYTMLATIAYAILRLYMYQNGFDQTIGECCNYLLDKSTKEVFAEIIEIENQSQRLEKFQEVFINKNRQL